MEKDMVAVDPTCKVCQCCGEVKKKGEYYRSSTTRDKLTRDCKKCFSGKVSRRQKRNYQKEIDSK